MKPIVHTDIEKYAYEHTRPEPDLLITLSEQTHREMEAPQMLTGRLEGRFLKFLTQIFQPRLILEIGMFTGYSALSMAEGLEEDGRVITCDINPDAQKIAQAAFDKSPYGKKIEIRMGPALDTIRGLNQEIDMSFIDADKENYGVYYEEVLKRTRAGGLIIIDNTLWSGKVLNPQDDSTRAIAKLNDTIARDERVENVLLTVRDGIQLVRKKDG